MEESLAPVENSGEDVLSMVDVLKEENDLEEEANAVLGDSDDQNCTYPKVNFFTFTIFYVNEAKGGFQSSIKHGSSNMARRIL